MNKKTLLVIILSGLVILALIFLGIFLYQKNKKQTPTGNINFKKEFAPEFLSVEEKQKLSIPPEAKIQAMTRDENGEIEVYRIIKTDNDIVDPDTVGPISPRVKK